jgi:WXXGXW repeat (2 copies)
MRSRFFSIAIGTIGLAAFVSALTIRWSDSPSHEFAISVAAAEDAPPPPMPADDTGPAAPAGAEVLAQGPVHEAFANPVDMNPQPGPIVAKRPPDPVEEIPPEQQPEGDNIVWIPGYWAWDDDRTNFLWVSGVLRNAPPGQTWVPGYWSEVNGGYQWTPGFWTAAAKEQVQYLPAPPQSLETQATPAPGENFFWIPGTWIYQDHYVWRPGYWTACRPNWIWNPAHYSWTPCGFVFIDGYWDYAIARRGCLFAPVYFNQPLYARAGFVWTPSVLINVGLFTDHLFVRPSFCHYYFGDFYATRYAGLGFQPWFSLTIGGGRRYDPLFTYYRWNNSRTDRNWLAHTQQHFAQLQQNEALRPPHTFVAQETLLKRGGATAANAAVVSTISQVAKDPGQTPFKFHNVDQRDRQVLANNGKELQKVSQERIQIERTNKGSGNLGVGGAGIAGDKQNDKQNNDTLGKGWKLPTAASSKVTLSAQNQNNNSGGNNMFGDGNRTQKDPRLLGSTNNSNNNSASGAGRGNLTDSAGNKNNQNGTGNSFLNRDRTGNMLGQGGNSNPTGSTGAGRGNSVGAGGLQSNPLGAGNSNSTGTNNSTRSALTDGGRIFVPPQGSGGRSGGLQSGSGVQSGVAPGYPSLGNTPRFGGGEFQSGGNGTAGGNTNERSFNNSQPRMIAPSGSSGGASGNGAGSGSSKGSGGGSQPGGRDRDDKNKNSSYDSPRTDMNLEPRRSSVVDVQNVLKTDRSTVARTKETPADVTARDIKDAGKIDMGRDDDLAVDNKPPSTATPDRSTANQTRDPSRIQLPTNYHFRSQLSSGGPNGLLGASDRSGSVAQQATDSLRGGSGGNASARGTSSSDQDSGNSRGGNTGSSSGGSKIAASPDPRAGGASLSKYNYQNMKDRGRSLSDRVASGADAGSPTEPPDVNVLRRVKDPVAGFGISGDRTVYGPGGADGSPAPSSTAGLDDRPAGLGSYSSSATLPRMSHFDTRLDRHSSQTPVNDAAARTYDPARGGY